MLLHYIKNNFGQWYLGGTGTVKYLNAFYFPLVSTTILSCSTIMLNWSCILCYWKYNIFKYIITEFNLTFCQLYTVYTTDCKPKPMHSKSILVNWNNKHTWGNAICTYKSCIIWYFHVTHYLTPIYFSRITIPQLASFIHLLANCLHGHLAALMPCATCRR
jgi:hypothetical protein